MKICVVDDEKWTRLNIVKMLQNLEPDWLVEACSSGSEALELSSEYNFDCYILDIELNDLQGITLSKALQKMNEHSQIIFSTAHDQYAVKAYELGAIDYLCKPYNQERLKKALDWLNEKEIINTKSITIDYQRSKIIIETSDIIYIESQLKKCIIQTTSEQYEIVGSLSYYEAILDDNFIRCHKSYLVNWAYVKAIIPLYDTVYGLTIKDTNKKIPISRKLVKQLKDRL